jgi:copper chaperone
MTRTYDVGGMTCDGCARAVTGAIEKAVPGARVAVDLASARVTVDRGDEQAIRTAVETAGFEFRGVVAA